MKRASASVLSSRFGIPGVAAAGLALLLSSPSGCRVEPGDAGEAFGGPVEISRAVPLATVLTEAKARAAQVSEAGAGADADDDAEREVVVRGRIGEVCRSAGCWLELESGASSVFVDLESATFRVEPSIQGREAVVAGRLVGRWPDLELHARGMWLEPENREEAAP